MTEADGVNKMRIWKWTLMRADHQTITMPYDARVLTVQMQGDDLQLWALVHDQAGWPKQDRTFSIYGTGNPIPLWPGEYIATVQTHNGSLVWHIFERSNLEVDGK